LATWFFASSPKNLNMMKSLTVLNKQSVVQVMKKLESAIVISALLLLSLVNVYWIYKNSAPPGWDDATYLEASERIYQSVNKGIDDLIKTSTEVLQRRAPLISYVALPVYMILGASSFKIAMIENLIWLVLFYVFFYLLLSKTFNKKIAIMSIFITSTMPLFYGLVRHFYVEFGLMAIIIIWVYFLFKTKHLSKKKYLLILGFITGLGLLMKITFPVYISGFLLLEACEFIRRRPSISRIVRNLVLFSVPILVAAPWYIKNLPVVLWHAKRSLDPAVLQQFYYGSPFSPRVVYLTLLDITNYVISWYYLAIAAILFFGFVIRGKIRIDNYLLISLIPPFLYTLFSPNKDYRLILPIVPLFGFAISWMIWAWLKERSLIYLPIFLLIPFFMFVNVIHEIASIFNRFTLGPILVSDTRIGLYAYWPDTSYWPIEETLRFIANSAPGNKKRVILTTSEIKEFNINNLKYFAAKQGMDLEFKSIAYSGISYSDITNSLTKADFIIELESPHNEFNGENLRKYKEISQKINWIKVDNDLILPDGYKLLIYKNPQL